jgi:hypothetical protein
LRVLSDAKLEAEEQRDAYEQRFHSGRHGATHSVR